MTTLPPVDGPEGPSLPPPADIADSYVEVAQRASRLLAETMRRWNRRRMSFPSEELRVAKAFMDVSARLLANPYRLAQTQMAMMRDHVHLWQQSMLKTMGMPSHPVAVPDHGDPRFADRAWEEDFLFDFIKQSYLITARHLQGNVARAAGLDAASQRQVQSRTEQYVAALSPTNFALTNPEVLRATWYSKGRNLINGLRELLKDLEHGDGVNGLPIAGGGAFRLGKDIAATPGKVVFENELLQLIQYQPTTAEQHRRPLLIVPPWINKYYVFDLRESNSFVKWATDQGLTTFVISWASADGKLAQKSFDDYLSDGLLAAIDAVELATGEKEIHLLGYCLGGTLVMATLAWMAARGDARAASASLFASLIDFSDPGEVGDLAEQYQLRAVDEKLRADLESPLATDTFRIPHANELLWSFVINSYLLGRGSFPADLLYWSADATRVPVALHRFVLENLVEANRLVQPGGLSLAGSTIDIGRVKIPCYFLSTIEDRMSPWQSSYLAARVLGGQVRFVLGGAGHVTGLVNPPAANRHGYWINTALPGSTDDFLGGATRHPGSWWTDWRQWLLAQAGDSARVLARTPGAGPLEVIEEAPGRYAAGQIRPPGPGLATANGP